MNAHTVDLATVLLPDDHKIWKLFPGEGYKFLKTMLEGNIVFLDVRGLTKLGDDPRAWKPTKLLETISKDRWERQNRLRDEQTERRVSPNDRATVTFLNGLLLTAKKGDLIAVPHQGSNTYVSVGEFTEHPGETRTIEVNDERKLHQFVGRRVKWLQTLNKRSIDQDVLERLQTPVAFFDMGDAGRNHFYRSIYDNFVYDGVSVATFHTQKEFFTSRDNRNLSSWIGLIEVLNTSIYDPKIAARIREESLSELIDEVDIPEDRRSDLAININSPGSVLMRAIAQTPLIALALFPMASAELSYAQAKEAVIKVRTVGGAADGCSGQVADSVRQILENLGAAKWRKACLIAKRAESETTLGSRARLKSAPGSATKRK